MAFADAVLALSPSSYWKLSESAGPTAVDDAGSIDGTYDGGGTTFSHPPLPANDTGTSVSFTASVGGAIEMGDNYDFTGTTSFTLMFWGCLGEFSAANGHFTLCKRRVAPTADGWSMFISTPAITLAGNRIVAGSVDQATHLVAESDLEGKTVFFGMTYNGTEIQLYLNGAAVGSAVASSASLVDTTAPLTLGKFSLGGSGWDGRAAHGAIWDGTALTAAQFTEIWAAGTFTAEVAWLRA